MAGTIIADNDDYYSKGMANESILYSRDYNADLVEMTNAAAGLDPNLTTPLILSNHSYGKFVGWAWADLRGTGTDAWYWMAIDNQNEDPMFGDYNQFSYDNDLIAYDAPYYTIVRSSGNDRGEGPEPNSQHWVWNGENWVSSTSYHPKDGDSDGFDCLPPDGVAKNIITVGSIDDISYGYQGPSDVQQVNSSFSTWGPTVDGRIKPDIVANGDALRSTLPNNTFGSFSGTSMSAPNVTGSLALLLQHYKNTHNNTIPLSSTLKAIVIHSADEAGENSGPDYKYGWGLLNTYKAAQLISQDQGNTNTIQELTIQSGQSYTLSNLYSDGTQPIKVTLTWNDIPPSNYQTGPILVQDLDVRLYKDGTPFYPWVLNPNIPGAPATTGDNNKDNVEQIFLQSPGVGYYSVVVTPSLSTSQTFSLIVTGFTSPFATFYLKQIGNDGQAFGQAAYWDNLMWNYVPPTQPVTFPAGNNHFLSTQDFRPSTYEKFNWWEDNLEPTNNWFRNWEEIPLSATTNLVASRFIPKYSGVTIKNSLEGTSVTGGTLFFYDPWLTDFNEPPYGLRNQGISAPPKQRNSPFYPDYTTSYNGDIYKGIFLNQNPTFDPDLPLYNVWAGDQQINLGGLIGTKNFYFQNWSATGANLQPFGSGNQSRVIFTSSNAVVQANLKGQGLSNNQNAYTNNSQRKFVKTDDGFLHSVYESMGKVWYEYSSNNGATWQLVPLGEGKNPTIDFFQNYIIIACQVDIGSGGTIAVGCFVKSGSTYIQTNWITTEDVTSPTLPPYEINANPVIAITFGWYVDFPEILLIWDHPDVVLPAGIYYMRARLNVTTNQIYWVPDTYPVKITNTDINSNNPTIYARKNAGHIFHIAWGQSQSSIKYCSANASMSGISFSSIITPSSGSGFSIHYNPSIIELNGSARITWAAKYNGTSPPVVIFKASDYYRFWNFGGNVSAPNINKSNDNTYYAFTWSEGGSTTKFADNTLSTIRNLNTTGNYVHVSNGPNKDGMYAEVFRISGLPYYFKTTPDLGDYYPPQKMNSIALGRGRQGTIFKDDAEFYFAFGDIQVNDATIDFIEAADTVAFLTTEDLNQYLLTEPFDLNDNSGFFYSVQFGVTDSASAINSLGEDEFASFKVELIDNASGEVLGIFDDITFSASNITEYTSLSYQVNVSGIGNRTVRLRLVTNNNFNPMYSMTDKYADENVLPKNGFNTLSYKGSLAVESYDLAQNYPNPFNPSTIIKYQIPEDGIVSLKIFDILGKELKTLINEQKTIGKYEVTFDASNLASGVYIYRIQVNDYVSSKKMMLLK